MSIMKKLYSFLPSLVALTATVVFVLAQQGPIQYDLGYEGYFIDWGILASIIILGVLTLGLLVGALRDEKFSEKNCWYIIAPVVLFFVSIHALVSTWCFRCDWISDINHYVYYIHWGWLVTTLALATISVVAEVAAIKKAVTK